MSIYKMRTQFGGALKVLLGIIALGFLIGGIFSFSGAPVGRGPQANGASDVVAVVNGSEIKRQEFETAWDQVVNAGERRMVSPLQYADMRAGIFQELVQSRLLLSAAAQMGVDVSNRRVNDEIDKQVVEYLKQNRDVVLGKAGKGENRPEDPRDDADYKRELASIGSSVSQQEEFARSRVSEGQVRAKLAWEGVQAKIKAGIKPVTEADIKASYDVYQIRQIVLPAGSLPKEQVSARAKKIRDAAVRGEDFAKLAKENSEGPNKDKGGEMLLSFDNRWFLPPQVREIIQKMKPGDISPVIDTQFGSYIVKLEGITPKPPAKLDKKTKDERKKQIQQEREMTAQMAFQEELSKKQDVKVMDPELDAYWKMYEARQAFADRAEYEKKMKLAVASLRKAVKERPNNNVAAAKLAQLLDEQGKTEEAIRLLYPLLEGKNASMEGADIRVMLGDMLLKTKETEKAIEQYKVASEVALKTDLQTHQRLMAKFQDLKRPDLVAAEQKWIDDYNVRMKELEAMRKKANPEPTKKAPLPAPGG